MILGVGIGIGVGTGVPWGPAQIPNLKAWYRGDLGVTNVSGKASVWADQSGAGDSNRNFAQATSANRPTIVATNASFNNQSTLQIVAGDPDFMKTGTFTGGAIGTRTVMVVLNFVNTTAGKYMVDGLAGNDDAVFNGSSGSHKAGIYAGVELDAGTADTNPHIIVGVFNGASSKIYIDSTTAAATGDAGSATITGLVVGGYGANPALAPGGGDIAELALASGIMADADIARFMNYASQRYGIALS